MNTYTIDYVTEEHNRVTIQASTQEEAEEIVMDNAGEGEPTFKRIGTLNIVIAGVTTE